MSLTGRCIIGRTAKIALRTRGRRYAATPRRVVTVAFPARWSRSTLLAYVRRHHPGETVRILEWHDVHDVHGVDDEPLLWLANPAAFSFTNYVRGELA